MDLRLKSNSKMSSRQQSDYIEPKLHGNQSIGRQLRSAVQITQTLDFARPIMKTAWKPRIEAWVQARVTIQ